MTDNTIDQDRYNRLADWAESDTPEIHPHNGETGAAAADHGRAAIRRAGGRPSIDPDADAGAASPRRQVRLPRALSEQLDALAEREHRSASDVMRDAIADYISRRSA